MTKILMVCLGNICRSPLAHGILESMLPPDQFYVDSAGTGNYHIGSPPDHRSVKVAKKYGIDISKQQCRQFQASDFDRFDYIFVMDASNLQNVKRLARNSNDVAKIRLILNPELNGLCEVPDPYYGDDTDFEKVFHLLNEACSTISEELRKS